MSAAALLLSSPTLPSYNRMVFAAPPSSRLTALNSTRLRKFNSMRLEFVSSRPDFRAWADDGDADGGGPEDYDMDDDEVEEVDNKKDFDIDYDTAATMAAGMAGHGGDDDIAMVDSKSFVYTQGWDSDKIVDYRINEDEFHKICLLDCDFFIRKPPDPDNDVYDFREMYVTPPDTDVYSIPKVFAPMPQKYIRCAQSDYGCYNVTEPPIDAPRDPMYKSEKEVFKVFLVKHYRNRRLGDPEFVLDFEEIYVIDSKTKSITRARVVVHVFSWIVALEKLQTCDSMQRRWPGCYMRPNWCCLCRDSEEDQDHLLLHCSFSHSIWLLVLNELGFLWSFPEKAKEMFYYEPGWSAGRKHLKFWYMIVHCVFWTIWKERNSRIFEDKSEQIPQVWEKIKFAVATWTTVLKDYKDLRIADLVTVPEGRDRDRKNDLLVVRDSGNSFKIIRSEERDDPTTVIEKEEWSKTREDMEKHLRKLRDFSVSNWF